MGKKSGGGSTTTEMKIPGWVKNFSAENLNLAGDIAERPYQSNPWLQMAGLTPEQQEAYKGIVAQQGAYKPWLQQGASPAAMIAGTAAPSAQMVSQYMNPYTQQVIDAAGTDIERARQSQIGGIKDAAHGARAFGGDRQAIAEAAANRAAMETTASTSANLRNTGYQNAMAAAQSDLAMQLGAGSQLANLAQQGQGMDYKDLAALEAAGQAQQGQTQGAYDLEAQKWQDAWQYPINMLDVRLNALGQTPYGTSQTGPAMQRNMGAGILGGGMAGAGLASTMGLAGPWGWGAAGLGAILGGLM